MKAFLNKSKNFYIHHSAVVYLLVLVVLASLFVPHFCSLGNFQGLLKQWAVPAILCVGMNFVIVTGGIDLSMGYVLSLASVSAGVLLKFHGWNPMLAILIGVIIGGVFGSVNGAVISFFKVPPFIATLGSNYIAYGLAQIVSGGRSINKLGDAFMNFGNKKIIGTLPLMFFYAAAIVAVGYFLMNHTTYGRNLQYIGYNEKTAILSGVKAKKHIFISYISSGLLAGFAGILLAMRTAAAAPTLGNGDTAFDAVTACVLGGTLLSGGFSPVIASTIGVLILKIIENCINLLNMNTYIYDAVRSLIIFAAIVADSLKRQKLR